MHKYREQEWIKQYCIAVTHYMLHAINQGQIKLFYWSTARLHCGKFVLYTTYMKNCPII